MLIKLNEIVRFPLLLMSGISLILLFTSYGNKKVHPDLNAMMVDAFLKRNNQGEFSLKEFQKYTFNFDQADKLKGYAVVKNGYFSANDIAAAGVIGDIGAVADKYSTIDVYCDEGLTERTTKQWIMGGGFSADVPEIPASLRHFYDPTRNEGDRYLTDIANSKVMGTLQKYALSNPHTDGVEWALGKPGDLSADAQSHQYTWERGKMWMQMALHELKKDKRNEFMAKAWRSLGETLHMIADNGCPPHVRNDAHPSPVLDYDTWFGDADPYEELVDIIRRDNEKTFNELASGIPDATLKQQFRDFKSVREIAHALAVFTNTNFVTNQTISGIDKYGNEKKQITHPDFAYTSPLLQNMTYNESDHAYYSSIGIKECVDREYFAKYIPRMCEPKVDMECVKSQAAVLFPNIIEAGTNAIRLFIPKLKVEIKSAENNIVKGAISHIVDDEYPELIAYSGTVTLQLKDKNFRIKNEVEVVAHEGLFECKELSFGEEGDKVSAYIEFGGVSVQSEQFECGSAEKEFAKLPYFYITIEDAMSDYSTGNPDHDQWYQTLVNGTFGHTFGIVNDELKWSGNNFSTTGSCTVGAFQYQWRINGNVSNSQPVKINGDVFWHKNDKYFSWDYTFKFKNIPVKSPSMSEFYVKAEGESLISYISPYRVNLSGPKETVTCGINYSKGGLIKIGFCGNPPN